MKPTFSPVSHGHEAEVVRMLTRKYNRQGKTFVKPERWNFSYDEDNDRWVLSLPEGEETFKVDVKHDMVQIF